MKTIEQLLALSKNPYYTFPPDEKRVLDDFLSKRRGSVSKKSQKKNSDESEKKTPVHVTNVVEKTDTYAPKVTQSS